MPRALVTGAGGFAGQWLCKELLSDGWDVHGATLTGAPALTTLQEWQRDAITWYDVDLRQREDVGPLLDSAKPDAVFHLAGIAFVPDAGADPGGTWSTNVLASVHLLDAITSRRKAGAIDPVVVIAGSGEQYGAHPAADLPLSEDAEQRPLTVYAATKVAQEVAALAHWRATGTKVIAARPFNHTGPGQATSFLLPALVERAHDAKKLKSAAIRIGNANTVRDFLHVEDVARAYIYLAQRGEPGEAYNICSGEGKSVSELAQLVLDRMELDARVESDPALMRAVDVPALVGTAAKLTAATTWTPMWPLEMVIDEVVYGEAY